MSRGKKIVELFTNLKTHIEDRDGQIDMGTGVIGLNSTREKVCIGCWIADYFEARVYRGNYRCFHGGIKALEELLGVDNVLNFLKNHKQHWHNCHATYAFHLSGKAYGADRYPSITDVTDAWVDFGNKLQTKGSI